MGHVDGSRCCRFDRSTHRGLLSSLHEHAGGSAAQACQKPSRSLWKFSITVGIEAFRITFF